MEDTTKTQEVFDEAMGKALETVTVWAEANQRLLREMVELSAVTAKENLRLYAELQQSAIEAIRGAHAATMRWTRQDAPSDPRQCYQKAISESIDGAQKVFRLLESNAQAVSQSAERLQASAERAGKGIQETFGTIVNKTKEIYARA